MMGTMTRTNERTGVRNDRPKAGTTLFVQFEPFNGTPRVMPCASLGAARALAQKICDVAYDSRLTSSYVPGDELRPRTRIPADWNGARIEYDVGSYLSCVADPVAVEQDAIDYLPA